jgi:hypothetical protein
MVFEHRGEPLLPRRQFVLRLLKALAVAGTVIGISLGLGTIGYHALAGLPWIDAFLDAAMILTGMGPVAPLRTTTAKLFAAGYALFSGLAFLTSVAMIIAPIFHRVVHRLHLDIEDCEVDEDPGD